MRLEHMATYNPSLERQRTLQPHGILKEGVQGRNPPQVRLGNSGVACRALPFAAYLAFLALAEAIYLVSGYFPHLADWATTVEVWMYPLKIGMVLALLVYFWPQYKELQDRGFDGISDILMALAVGALVYVAWVRMDWSWASQGKASGYDPFSVGSGMGVILAGVRVFGATVVIPIVEELFWRSFLLRYIISTKFETVSLGTFTVWSFVITVILFGLEHHLWLAGMMRVSTSISDLPPTRSIWRSWRKRSSFT